jgi:hypothetical protein
VGGEFNVRLKPGAEPRIVLSYPDVYEIGISNPALQILYAHLNDATPASAERAYCPWPDMADLMRAAGAPLWTLESRAAVRDCDLWGFTLPHELTYTNVLEMLDLAGVPLHAGERGEDDPIVLGGGPAVADPWPLAPFLDAFFIGEVEHRLDEIVEAAGRPAPSASGGSPPCRACGFRAQARPAPSVRSSWVSRRRRPLCGPSSPCWRRSMTARSWR